MSDVVVVTDSTSGLPDDVLKAWGIPEVSLYVCFPDGSRYRERELEPARFYDELAREEQTRPPRRPRSRTS